jgi:hypothetical protein
MERSGKAEKLSYSGPNLEKMAGKIQPLNPGNSHNLRDSFPDNSIDFVIITHRPENQATIYCGGGYLPFSLLNPAYRPNLIVIPEHFLGPYISGKWREITGFKEIHFYGIFSMYL